MEKPRLRISTPKPKLPLLNNSLPLRPTTTPDTTTLAMITLDTIMARVRLLRPVMRRKMMTRTTEKRLMPMDWRTRISSWS